MTSLAATFQLITVLLYIAARRPGPMSRQVVLLSAAGLAWLLGLGSKESAAITPLVLWLYEWSPGKDAVGERIPIEGTLPPLEEPCRKGVSISHRMTVPGRTTAQPLTWTRRTRRRWLVCRKCKSG